MIAANLARYGTPSAEKEDRVLAVGPLEVRLLGGAIQAIRFRGRHMLGSLAFLVRDRGWGTVPIEFEHMGQEIRADRFSLKFACTARGSDIDLSWETQIEASAEGLLTLSVRGRANGPTTTNRAGLVALHPTSWAGAKVEVVHPDGTQTAGILPRHVDPEPCFTDFSALRLAQHDARVDLRFTGGTWEMEDQRNWLDASFKTYFRPLSLPYPYDISAEFFQSVTATFGCDEATAAAPASSTAAVIDVAHLSAVTSPRLGLRSDGRYAAHERANATSFADLGSFTLHASLDLRSPAWRQRLAEMAALAAIVARPVCLEVIPNIRDTSFDMFDVFAVALRESNLAVESILISLPQDRIRLDPGPPAPPHALLLDVHQQARRAFPGTPIGGGTLGFFAELNRNWPPLGLVDFVANASSSIVHAADTSTLIENVASYADIAETVRAVCGTLPHRWISATIGVLENPYNPPTRSPRSGEPMPMREFDPRHGALFGAAWTLASFCALAKASAAEVVPASLCGPVGIVSGKLDGPQPWYDEQDGPRLYPVYHVVRALGRLSGTASQVVGTSHPAIHAIGRAAPDRSFELWLTNLSTQLASVEINGAADLRVATLDESSFERASVRSDFLDRTEPSNTPKLELRPYAISHVTFLRRS
jgi:hypothetical protein